MIEDGKGRRSNFATDREAVLDVKKLVPRPGRGRTKSCPLMVPRPGRKCVGLRGGAKDENVNAGL